MLKTRLLFFLTLFLFLYSNAQTWKKFRYEMLFGVGVTNFLGELGGANSEGSHFLKDLRLSMTRPMVDLGFRNQLGRHVSMKAMLAFGMLTGDDKSTNDIYRNYRNLSFRSPIVELSLQGEYWPLRERFKLGGYTPPSKISRQAYGRKHFQLKVNPYLFGGLGVFYFNPQAKYHGKWVNLQPLGTEGEGLVPTRPKYKLVQVSIPIGFGLKIPFFYRYLLGIEYGVRKTFTDYIDDVSTTYYDPALLAKARGEEAAALSNRSDPNNPDAPNSQKANPKWTSPNMQRGNPKYKDSYMFMTVRLIYKIRQYRRNTHRF